MPDPLIYRFPDKRDHSSAHSLLPFPPSPALAAPFPPELLHSPELHGSIFCPFSPTLGGVLGATWARNGHFGVRWLCLEAGRRARISERFKVDLLDEFFLQKELCNPKVKFHLKRNWNKWLLKVWEAQKSRVRQHRDERGS